MVVSLRVGSDGVIEVATTLCHAGNQVVSGESVVDWLGRLWGCCNIFFGVIACGDDSLMLKHSQRGRDVVELFTDDAVDFFSFPRDPGRNRSRR